MMMMLMEGLSLHQAVLHFARSGAFNPTGPSVIMALTLDQRVNINATSSLSKIATNRTDAT